METNCMEILNYPPKNSSPESRVQNVDQILNQLGKAVLIGWPNKVKGNNTVKWKHLGLSDMTPDYLTKASP